MPSGVIEGKRLWSPSNKRIGQANVSRYMDWLKDRRGRRFRNYDALWTWSTEDIEGFWLSIWDYFNIQFSGTVTKVLDTYDMPGARWFPGTRLNYAEHALKRCDDHPAIIFEGENISSKTMSYRELNDAVARAVAGLRRLGVKEGDRVVAYATNVPETVVTFLAVASIGAIWSSCSPEFGTQSIIDRFQQIEPTVMVAVRGYTYKGKKYDRLDALKEITRHLPTLKGVVILPNESGVDQENHSDRSKTDLRGEMDFAGVVTTSWEELTKESAQLQFTRVPFEHPLWILFSSGTTGLPKAIVHGHGGILLEHMKALAFHLDLGPDDRFFWQTTTGWMMWNFLVSGLLLGTTIILYEGSPVADGPDTLWKHAEKTGVTYFGTSAPYIEACMKARITPGRHFDLSRLNGVGSTGAPLSPEGFEWVYNHVHDDVVLGSLSGGTDVCTAFVLPCPILPVYSGEIQCRGLGADIHSFDEKGRAHIGDVGELVMTKPFPSMPVFFWNDPQGARYKESYFHTYDGVWCHGDWVKVTERGSLVIYGRSDSTLNRSGIRAGTSDYYRVVQQIPGIEDSLVIDTGGLGREGKLLLFVVLEAGHGLDDELRQRITNNLREHISPRHVPDEIVPIKEVPRTLNGKKMEVPIRRILTGTHPDDVVTPGAVANPKSIDFFIAYAADDEKGDVV